MPMDSRTHQSTITESDILTSYLLTPSSLTTFLPYNTFLTLLPASQRSNHTQCKRLYTDLRFQRNIEIDTVQANIERECTLRSTVLRTKLARAVRDEVGRKKRKRSHHHDDENVEDGQGNQDSEMEVEDQLDTSFFGHRGLARPSATKAYHDSDSLLSEMELAMRDLEVQIKELDRENASILAQMSEIVGSLSDLRYGRFAQIGGNSSAADGNGRMDDGVDTSLLQSLSELKRVCDVGIQ